MLPDPCPTPAMEQAAAKATGKTGRRRLDEKEKKLYAPFSDRSGLKITGDHIVITRENGFTFDKDAEDVERGEGEQLIVDLQGERRLLGQTDQGVSLFAGSAQISSAGDGEGSNGRKTHRSARLVDQAASDDDEMADSDAGSEGEDDSEAETDFDEQKLGKLFRQNKDQNREEGDLAFADSDSDLGSISGGEYGNDDGESDEDDAVKWKENMIERARSLHGKRRSYRAVDLARLVYSDIPIKDALKQWRGDDDGEEGEGEGEGEGEEEGEENIEDEEFFQKTQSVDDVDTSEDATIPMFDYEALAEKWANEEHIEALRHRFATARLHENENDDVNEEEFGGDEDGEGDGAFEDLETGETHGANDMAVRENDAEPAKTLEEERERNARRKEELRLRFEEEDREGFRNEKANLRREAGADDEYGEDQWYEAEKAKVSLCRTWPLCMQLLSRCMLKPTRYKSSSTSTKRRTKSWTNRNARR